MPKRRKLKTKVRIFLYLSLLAIALFYCNRKSRQHSDPLTLHHVRIPEGFSVLGVDVSHHNGDINWKEVKAQGIVFAYIKASEGVELTDKNYVDNYTEAKNNGIVPGMYHFFIFKEDGILQAKYFLEKLHYRKGDLPPAVDVEYSSSNKRNTEKAVIKERITELRQFDSVIYAKKHFHPVLYTNKECYEDLIRDKFPNNDLWLCNLSEAPDDNMYPNWVLWQHSHKGKLSGLKSKTDMNVFYSTKEEFRNWLNQYHKAYTQH